VFFQPLPSLGFCDYHELLSRLQNYAGVRKSELTFAQHGGYVYPLLLGIEIRGVKRLPDPRAFFSENADIQLLPVGQVKRDTRGQDRI